MRAAIAVLLVALVAVVSYDQYTDAQQRAAILDLRAEVAELRAEAAMNADAPASDDALAESVAELTGRLEDIEDRTDRELDALKQQVEGAERGQDVVGQCVAAIYGYLEDPRNNFLSCPDF